MENDETIVTIMTTGNITIHVDISIETTDPIFLVLRVRPHSPQSKNSYFSAGCCDVAQY